MRKVTKTTKDGRIVAVYQSVTEAARANNSTPQRIYARVQWHTLLDGYYYVSDEIEPMDRDARNARRRAKYLKHPRRPRPPRPPRRPRQPKPPPQKPQEQKKPYSRAEIARWVAIVPAPFREACASFMFLDMHRNRNTAKKSFAKWYIGFCPCYISSDKIVETGNGTD